jgi:hypothetical protein
MEPKTRQKATRQKSTRQRAIRRTYKQVKGGAPFTLNIKWNKYGLFGILQEKGDSDNVIFDKINTYIDMIQNKIQTYADLTLLMPKLEEADKAIDKFETQRIQTHHSGYNGSDLVLKLRKRAVAIGKSIQKAISDEKEEATLRQIEANKGKRYRAGLNRFLEERRQNRERSPRVYIPPNEYGNKLRPVPMVHSAPMGRGNNSNRNKLNTAIYILEQQKRAQNAAQSALISPDNKRILNTLF